MKRLTESDSLKFKNISAEEKARRGILGRLYGTVASFANPTRNGRHYSQELWEQVFNSDLVKERFANGGIFGELCHPADREEVEMDRVAIVMPEPPVKDNNGNLIAYVDIIDTPAGRIAYQLAKYGYKFGISTRGTGDIIEGVDGDEVDPDTYQLNALDLVEVPAVESARLQFVESLNTTKRYGKTLKESLQKVINKADDKDKKVMLEALDDLGVELEEDAEEEIEPGVLNIKDVNQNKYPFLYDALDCDAISLSVNDGAITNDTFDRGILEENEIDEMDVKADIERFAEHRGIEFQFNERNTQDPIEDVDIFDDEYEEPDFEDKEPDYQNEGPIDVSSEDEFTSDEVDKDDFSSDYEGGDNYSDFESEMGYNEDESNVEESFDPSGYTKVIQAINAGIETDEDEESLSEYLAKIIGYCKSIADDYDLYIPAIDDEYEESLDATTKHGSHINEGKEVVNDKSTGLIAELQESLNKIKRLEKDNLSLQEKLSVGSTKEAELSEQLAKYKQAITRLSESAVKVKKLTKELNESRAELTKSKQIAEKLSKSELSAKMALGETDKRIDNYKAENKALTEQVNDLSGKLNEANARLKKSAELNERYKKSYNSLKESYLNLRVQNYGLNKDEVKQKLGESYKIKEIDAVCEELNQTKLNLSKLPFRLNENTKIGIKGSTKVSETSDDYVSESLLNMLN